MSDTLFIWSIGLGLTALFVFPMVFRIWSQEERTRHAEAQARAFGLHEPVSMHPVVDPAKCVGTASCVEVCPEQDVIGIRHGQAITIAPAACVGHGCCERSCPVDAIQLVFGTAKRGVDIPRIDSNFETNIPGLVIIGELGGMGLIRNAFEQGRQCLEGIAANSNGHTGDVLDLVIVGCGPGALDRRRRGEATRARVRPGRLARSRSSTTSPRLRRRAPAAVAVSTVPCCPSGA